MTNSRQKGKRGELEAVHCLRDELGFPPLSEQPHEGPRRAQQVTGTEVSDIVGVHDDLHVEVKRRKQLAVWSFVKQVRLDKKKNQQGMILMRPDGDPDWHVMVRLKGLVQFCKTIIGIHERNTNGGADLHSGEEEVQGTDRDGDGGSDFPSEGTREHDA